jgi:aminoglycoside 3-N-acetyltransferase
MMTDKNLIQMQEMPNTRTSLANELKQLGVKEEMTIIVHASMSSLGWICGDAVVAVQALMDAVGENGTIVMPAQTVDNSDPSEWENPPIPKTWWQTIREHMPAFDPAYTPANGMGKIAETFRCFPGVKRSDHPVYSFAVWGKYADYILADQPLHRGFGQESPLGKIYDLNGFVLLIVVGHDTNTSLHLAEHSIPNRKIVNKGAAVFENGKRVWKTYKEIEYDSNPFEKIGEEFEKLHNVVVGTVGKAACKLINQREVVDFTKKHLNKK